MNEETKAPNPLPDVLPPGTRWSKPEASGLSGTFQGEAKLRGGARWGYYEGKSSCSDAVHDGVTWTVAPEHIDWASYRAALAGQQKGAEAKFSGTQPDVLPETLPSGIRFRAPGSKFHGRFVATAALGDETNLDGARYRFVGRAEWSDGEMSAATTDDRSIPADWIDWSAVPTAPSYATDGIHLTPSAPVESAKVEPKRDPYADHRSKLVAASIELDRPITARRYPYADQDVCWATAGEES